MNGNQRTSGTVSNCYHMRSAGADCTPLIFESAPAMDEREMFITCKLKVCCGCTRHSHFEEKIEKHEWKINYFFTDDEVLPESSCGDGNSELIRNNYPSVRPSDESCKRYSSMSRAKCSSPRENQENQSFCQFNGALRLSYAYSFAKTILLLKSVFAFFHSLFFSLCLSLIPF